MSYAAFANVSRALGYLDTATHYEAAADAIASMINSRFLSPESGVYADAAGGWNATQCGQALPLFLGIVPSSVAGAASSVLGANVAAHSGHLQVGGFGMKWLLEALSATGQAGAAYGIMTASDYPSFVRMPTEVLVAHFVYVIFCCPLAGLHAKRDCKWPRQCNHRLGVLVCIRQYI